MWDFVSAYWVYLLIAAFFLVTITSLLGVGLIEKQRVRDFGPVPTDNVPPASPDSDSGVKPGPNRARGCRAAMRVIAIALLLGLVALAVVFVARRHSSIPPTGTEYQRRARHAHRTSAPEPEEGLNPADTNTSSTHPQGAPEGFYLGKGGERVYINYGTQDPVLRSLLQSVMESSSDPNEQGKQIYQRICGACHQRGGEGKDGVAPPLAGSEWVLAPGGRRLVRIVLNGLTGPIQVQGRQWNLPMLPWRENLSDDQVAAVLTYVRSALRGNQAGPLQPELVREARKEGRTTPETAAELLQIVEP